MLKYTFLLQLLHVTLSLVDAAPRQNSARQSPDAVTCATVHIQATRGTFEPAGEGFIGLLSNAIKQRVPGSDSNATVYIGDASPYNVSEASGVGNLTQTIKDYVAVCPDTPIVLLGYSQGAQVVANTICGTDEDGADGYGPFETTPKLDFTAYGSHIKAVVTWGNPTHMANQTYNKGTSVTRNGIFGRNNVEDCVPYAPVWGDWCISGDLVCEKNGSSPQNHVLYPFTVVDVSANFTLELLASQGVIVTD